MNMFRLFSSFLWCWKILTNMLVISLVGNFKSIVLIVSPSLSQETVFFGTKILLLLPTISSLSFLSAIPGMSSFWLCFDKFCGEDYHQQKFLFSFFYPILPAIFFQNLDNQSLRWDGGFLLLVPHPQNEMKKSSILALVSITLSGAVLIRWGSVNKLAPQKS